MIILPANTLSTGGYEVANSCRFDASSSAYMHKTPSSTGVEEKFTFSFWIKFNSAHSSNQCVLFIEGDNGSDDYVEIAFKPHLDIQFNNGTYARYETNRKFRDPSAWYHIVIAVDTTQSTAGNRLKLYVNGTQETSWATETVITQNDELQANTSGKKMWLNAHYNGPKNFIDGYLAEVVWIDGTQYAASDFGEFDEDSPTIWKPKDVSGLTFGTNGFYLDFEDSSNLGNDANGGTDLTETNLAATDQSTDTPTNNFATLNPLHYESRDNTFAEGNLKITGTGSDSWTTHYGISTIAVSSGKWYVESKVTTTQSSQAILGLISTSQAIGSSLKDNGVAAVEQSGRITGGGNNIETGLTAWSNGDIAGLAFDATNGTAQFYRNGSAYGSSAVSSIASGTYYFATTTYDSGGVVEFNFGSPPYTISSGNADANGYGNFEYSVPTDYYALNTKNLAEFG